MQERKEYPPGVPCWIDTEQPDPEAAARFYGELFGWELEDRVPPEVPGHYYVARLGGRAVAGIGSRPAGAVGEPVWNTYVRVESTDGTALKVVEAGGRVVSEPADVGPGGRAGRVAMLSDPSGALIGVLEPRERTGAEAVNEPGTWNFSDLNTRDIKGAKAFYGEVFGWEADVIDMGFAEVGMWRVPGYGDFLEANYDPDIRRRQAEAGVPDGFEDAIAWMTPIGESDGPARWGTVFAVDGTDAVAEAAVKLGAEPVKPPYDDGGVARVAVLRDPQGAVFTVSTYNPG